VIQANGPTAAAGTLAIDVRVDDLAFFEGEAIIRPVNEVLGATTQVMRKLERAAGATYPDMVRPREPLPVGAAVVTNAGDLPVDLMIHGVVSGVTEPVTRDTVRTALMSALQRAVAFQIGDVAIAPFGLGAGNLDIEDSAEVMIDVLSRHMKRASYPTSVLIVAETELEEQMLRARLRASGRGL
jgi:O-acetyl-ADP-ribose deacetylase (regulator of RNase III)